MNYDNFIFRGDWRTLLETIKEQNGEQEAQKFLWSLMVAGTTEEIESDNPCIRALIESKYLPEIQRGKKLYKSHIGLSKGEIEIAKSLRQLGQNYIGEYKLPIKGPGGRPRRMDFALLDNDDNVRCFIEYQGQQHYKENNYFSSSLKEVQEVDEEKREWCKKQNIPLIEIPYWDLCRIDAEYLNKLIKNL